MHVCISCNQEIDPMSSRFYCDSCVEIVIHESTSIWNHSDDENPKFTEPINHDNQQMNYQFNDKDTENYDTALSQIECSGCNGAGIVIRDCTNCNGTGLVNQPKGSKNIRCTECDGNGYFLIEHKCKPCYGKGNKIEICQICYGNGKEVFDVHCDECKGNGYIKFKCNYCRGMGFDKIDVKPCYCCDTDGEIVILSMIKECDKCEGTGKLYEQCVSCGGNGFIMILDFEKFIVNQSKCDVCNLYFYQDEMVCRSYESESKIAWTVSCKTCWKSRAIQRHSKCVWRKVIKDQ